MNSLDRWIDRYLRRLEFGRFLERAAESLAAALLAFGSAVLVVKLLVPGGWPHVLWLSLALVPVTVVAWRLSQRDRFTRVESAALLDRKLQAGGLLMMLAEAPDGRWSAALPADESRWNASLPKVRPLRFAKLLGLPAAFAVAACFVPLREAKTEPTGQATVRQQATGQLQEMLDELQEADVLEPEEHERLQHEIEKLARESEESPLTHEHWETLDELRTRMQNRLEGATRTVSKGRDAATVLAEAAAEGRELSADRREQLQNDLAEALRKMADAEKRSQSREGEAPTEPQPNVEDSLRESPRDSRSESPTLKTARQEPRPPELTDALKQLAESGQLSLPQDTARQQEMLQQLQQLLSEEADKLAQIESNSRGQGRQGNRGSDSRDRFQDESGQDQPGRGGVGEGGGKSALDRGGKSDREGTTFRDVVLPPGLLDETRPEVVGVESNEPEVDPAGPAPRNPARSIDSAAGGETWKRQLRPRHRGVVRKYFESK